MARDRDLQQAVPSVTCSPCDDDRAAPDAMDVINDIAMS